MMPTIEQQLVLHEGEELSAYPDAKGYTTIGVGQCIDARAGGQISQAASRFMLDEKLTDITNGLSSTYQWFAVLGAIRQKVCQDIAYNVGLHGFSGFVLMIHALAQGDYPEAAAQIRNSAIAPIRRERLATMMESGQDYSA